MNFILKNKKLKIFKVFKFEKELLKNDGAAIKLIELPELEQINIQCGRMKNHLKLKTILGSEWEQTELKERPMTLNSSRNT